MAKGKVGCRPKYFVVFFRHFLAWNFQIFNCCFHFFLLDDAVQILSFRHFLLEKCSTITPTPFLVDISSLKKLPDSIQFCLLFPGKYYFSITNSKKAYVKLRKTKKMVTATTDVEVIKIFTVALQLPLTFFHKCAFSSTGFCIFRKLG